MTAPVPLYRSLLIRLLAASCVIAACAIAATAWLATTTATSALARQQGQTLAADVDIVSELSGYAADHKDWTAVAPLLGRLSEQFQLRIAVVGVDGRPIADSAAVPTPLPPTATATVDPLSFDTYTDPGAQTPGIDPRAVGPYLLSQDESDKLKAIASAKARCMVGVGTQAQPVKLPSGRYTVKSPGPVVAKVQSYCAQSDLDYPTALPSERKPLAALASATAACLNNEGVRAPSDLSVAPGFELQGFDPATVSYQQGEKCLLTARRDQLRPDVAVPAQLYLGVGAAGNWRFDLSGDNRARIAWTAGLVLTVTLALTTLVGLRLVRPLRALIRTARRDPADFARAPVTTRDETGYLALAFNQQTERRQQMDTQRKAMVADIAHELRSPLTNIRGWLEVTRDGLVTPTPDLITSLHDEAVVLQRSIDDLQDLASADAGTLRVHPRPVPVLDLLQHVALAHQAQAADAGITIQVETGTDAEVLADPERIRQVLGNLVSNALRHTPPGGSVTLAAAAEEDTVAISVQDTGTGIAEADLPFVFDRFWRSEKSRSRRTGGSGLGLAIARHLVQAHGGTIEAQSSPGTGTAMTVRLPGPSHSPMPEGAPNAPSRRRRARRTRLGWLIPHPGPGLSMSCRSRTGRRPG